jgi:hypothetical protein
MRIIFVTENDGELKRMALECEELLKKRINGKLPKEDNECVRLSFDELSAEKKKVYAITDQALLAGIAKTSVYWLIRKAAVHKITDPEILRDIAKNNDAWQVRLAAERRLKELR